MPKIILRPRKRRWDICSRNANDPPVRIHAKWFPTEPDIFLYFVGNACHLSLESAAEMGLDLASTSGCDPPNCLLMTGGFGTYFGAEWISWGTFLGLASLMVVAVEAIRTPKKQREVFTRMFYAGAVFPLLAMVVGYSIPLNLWLRPKTYDAFLLGFDRSLGFQPSFWLGRVVLGSYRIWGWTTVIYYALPFSGALLYASHRIRLRQPVAVLWLLLSFIIVGFAQYGVYPAVGPVHAFPALYPWKENLAAQIALQPLVVGADPRNCMPSLHLGAALLVWWNSRVWPVWGRICAGLFFLGTVFSTLSLGEHYLIDLVVAFPYALAFQAAWTTAVPLGSPRRITPLVAGFGMTAAWYLLLRYAIPGFLSSAVLSWVSIVATVWWSSSMKRNLDAAAQVVAISELTQASEATISF